MDKIIKYMLEEDKGFGDVTSDALIDEDVIVNAEIISKDNGIVAGIDIIENLFDEHQIEAIRFFDNGDKIIPGDVLLKLTGNARKILYLERTALNLFMRMSGVASLTNNIVTKVKKVNPKIIIAGTRKTSPALQTFDKQAIIIGGGDPHRFGLNDMVLIKDNHIAVVGSVTGALKRAKSNTSFSKKIEIEVETIEDCIDVVRIGTDIVMLDNFEVKEVENTLLKLNELNLRDKVLIEISGGINEDNILDYALLDVDIISLGALTHSTRSLDFSLNIL